MISAVFVLLVLLIFETTTCFHVKKNIRLPLSSNLYISRKAFLEADPPISDCDFRIGKIVSVDPINTFADSFYEVMVDVGGETPIQTHSFTIPFLENWIGRLVVVMCNVSMMYKAVLSTTAIMSWMKSDSESFVLEPPEDAKIGEPVRIEGIRQHPLSDLSLTKDAHEYAIETIKANDAGIAMYNNIPLRVSSGPVLMNTIKLPENELRLKRVDIQQYLTVGDDEGWERYGLEDLKEDDEEDWRQIARKRRPPTWEDRDYSIKDRGFRHREIDV